MPEYNIKVQFKRRILSFIFQEDKDIISAAKTNGIDLLNSFYSGFYTSWVSLLFKRNVEQEYLRGLNDDLRKKGFPFLCVAYPRTDLNVLFADKV